MPKVTFDTKELYEHAHHLCQQIPHWNKDSDNPIFHYICESEKPFKNTGTDFFGETQNSEPLRVTKLRNLSMRGTKAPLQLAATMSLMKRKKSPESKIRERKGFVTAARVPDVFEDKSKKAHHDITEWSRAHKQRVPKVDEYENPKPPVFRDEKEIEPGMKDFELRFKPDPVENPHFLSVFNKLPKYHFEREKHAAEKNEALQKFLAAGKPHDWSKYHDLPNKL